MKNFEQILMSSADEVRRSGFTLAKNIGRLIAFLALFIAAVITFADVRLTAEGIAGLTLEICVYLITSAILFFSLEREGELCGRETADFSATDAEVRRLANRILPERVPDLEAFCRKTAGEEHLRRRARFLASNGLTEEDLRAFSDGKRTDRRRDSLLRRAAGFRPSPLCAAMLLHTEKTDDAPISNPENTKMPRLTVKLLPSLAATVFTVSVAVSLKETLTPDTVAAGLIRLAALIAVGCKGFLQGYAFVTGRLALWNEYRKRLLGAFLNASATETTGAGPGNGFPSAEKTDSATGNAGSLTENG